MPASSRKGKKNMTTNTRRQNGRAVPPLPNTERAEQRNVSIDDFFQVVVEEIQAAEADVHAKESELSLARERLAAARGKLDLLGAMQRRAMGSDNEGKGA